MTVGGSRERARTRERVFIYSEAKVMLVKDAVSRRKCPPTPLLWPDKGRLELRVVACIVKTGLDSGPVAPALPRRCFLSGHGEMRAG